VGFGDVRHGVINDSNCADPDGIRAGWFVMQTPAGLTQFNAGVTGQITADFPLGAMLSDLGGESFIFGGFGEDPTNMFTAGTSLVAVLRVTGATPADKGAYDLSIDPAFLRQ
jgi:hypothetical protein